jgi:hypothetical protein
MTTYPYSSARLSRPGAPQIKTKQSNNPKVNRMEAIQRRLQATGVGATKRVRPGSVARPY